jgi:isoamylase
VGPGAVSGARAGRSQPLGAVVIDGGVNFSVFSEHAADVDLLLFTRPGDPAPAELVPLERQLYFWHAFVPGAGAGTVYALRASGSSGPGWSFDSQKALLDPYARSVATELWNRGTATRPGDNVAASLRSVVVDSETYDWEGDRPLERPLEDTIVYELHTAGFTKSPSAAVERPGTFTALAEKIPYLVELGITAVELLPVFQFDPTTGDFWGYNPIAHFAPHAAYGTVDEFRDLVKRLHRAGLEVILDVVFNHTGEAGAGGPTISFRGLANDEYYLLSPTNPNELLDFSGCGNTLNASNPITAKLIFDCLRYWVTELHVDGFRFDLGSVLTRGSHGEVEAHPPIVSLIELADELAGTKLIAEAWDAAGLYQVGSFPGRRWCEWNGRFRDDIRRFVRGDPGLVGAVATRIAGSSDLYADDGRPPQASVNFVTCHDGFTLNDLVSYNEKHNEANGEANRDGTNDNLSWNCGIEGDTAEAAVEGLRERQIRNFAVITMIAQGVPMFVAGDEVRRTQHGNNNAYCQDNEISWLDWTLLAQNAPLLRFWRLLIAFRKRHAALRRTTFFDGTRNERGVADVEWHGCLIGAPGWNDPSSRVLSFTLGGFDGDPDLHVILNMDDRDLAFELPQTRSLVWRRAFDTALAPPADASDPGQETAVDDGGWYTAGGRSAVVLVAAAS